MPTTTPSLSIADNNNLRAQPSGAQKVSPCGELLWGPTGKDCDVAHDIGGSRRSDLPHQRRQLCRRLVPSSRAGSRAAAAFRRSTGSPVTTSGRPVRFRGEPLHRLCRHPGGANGSVRAVGAGAVRTLHHESSRPPTASGSIPAASQLNNSGNPVIVFNTTSVQNGYFPPMLPDGNGGVVFGWYEIGGSRSRTSSIHKRRHVQVPVPIANTSPTRGRIRGINAGFG